MLFFVPFCLQLHSILYRDENRLQTYFIHRILIHSPLRQASGALRFSRPIHWLLNIVHYTVTLLQMWYFSIKIILTDYIYPSSSYLAFGYGVSMLTDIISSDRSSCTGDGLLHIYPKATFSDFHSVHWCNWFYKCHSKSLKQYQCNWFVIVYSR